MGCINLCVRRRPSQSFARETNSCSRTEVPVLGIDVNAISAYSFRVETIVLLVLLGLSNQNITFVAGIPAEPMQERKSITNRTSVLAPNSAAALAFPRTMGRTCRCAKLIRRSGMLLFLLWSRMDCCRWSSLQARCLCHQCFLRAERAAPLAIRASIASRLRCR